MKMIVGLGNPGKEYVNTRHNVGFMVIDNYCPNDKFKEKFNGLYVDKQIGKEKALFLKPLSYMNLSGTVVKNYADYFKINPEDILIIRDDLDLKLGQYKVKVNSSSGGDNGIKSIIECLNTNSFAQYKIGISNDKSVNTKDYVLGTFSKCEKDILNSVIDISPKIIESFIKNGVEITMNNYNGTGK